MPMADPTWFLYIRQIIGNVAKTLNIWSLVSLLSSFWLFVPRRRESNNLRLLKAYIFHLCNPKIVQGEESKEILETIVISEI